MSILGRGELIERLIAGDLTVSPILSTDQIGAASIDVRMGNVALTVRARGSSHVDPAGVFSGGLTETERHQKHERFEIPFREKFLLHPGSLALVPTLEWFKLPANLHGSVTARSTWAREGLSIATATFIEPRYEGIVTLELANLSQIPIALYPGLCLAQIAFTTVEGDTSRPQKPQFSLSFEPRQGTLAKPDEQRFFPPNAIKAPPDDKTPNGHGPLGTGKKSSRRS